MGEGDRKCLLPLKYFSFKLERSGKVVEDVERDLI
jgi:hypothetical protein